MLQNFQADRGYSVTKALQNFHHILGILDDLLVKCEHPPFNRRLR